MNLIDAFFFVFDPPPCVTTCRRRDAGPIFCRPTDSTWMRLAARWEGMGPTLAPPATGSWKRAQGPGQAHGPPTWPAPPPAGTASSLGDRDQQPPATRVQSSPGKDTIFNLWTKEKLSEFLSVSDLSLLVFLFQYYTCRRYTYALFVALLAIAGVLLCTLGRDAHPAQAGYGLRRRP